LPAQSAAEKTYTNSLGMKFTRIDAGTFTMGAGAAPPTSRQEWLERDHDEAPAHPVTIRQPFHLGIHEVTNAQYEAFDPKHKALRGKRGGSRADNDPVTYVTWHEANAFCAWLAKKEGKPYRLPTEAEWEYACRAGTTTAFYYGNELRSDSVLGVDAIFNGVFPYPPGITSPSPVSYMAPEPVGGRMPNAFGLYDMHGNAREWCLDTYLSSTLLPYPGGSVTNFMSVTQPLYAITRGGGVDSRGVDCRSAARALYQTFPAFGGETGFRVVLAP
jgi:formylglycine-generating enzyme required for sulfatase activity